MATVRKTGAVALCGAVPLALLLAGCGGGGGDAKPSETAPAASTPAPAPASSSAAPVDPDAAEKRAVLASYSSMWVEQMKAYGKASAKGTRLSKYAALDALSKFEVDLSHMKKNGTVIRGELGHDAKVSGLDLDGKLPKATIQDCVDLSKWQTLDTRTDKPIPLPSTQPLRYVATARAEKWPGGWMVTDYIPDGKHTC
ncbi:hypothetical protein [Streptomyces sp. NPDC056010]|uniref:hypothetical protein n=1 Tax=Streptomyces sp. NPDC056010 TaxID=3345679 RepID=UPI0035E31EF3